MERCRDGVLGAVLIAALMVGGATAAGAQSSDVKAMTQKLERLQADLKDLQRYVYSGGPLPESAATSGSETAGSATAAQVEVRISEIDQVIRQMRGDMEQISHRVATIETRLDKLIADLDLRLSALEHGGAALPPAAATGQEPAATAGATTAAGDGSSGTLGTLTVTSPDEPVAAATGAEPLPPGSPMDQYNYAFGLLSTADYVKAEQALNAFIQAYPEDPLAGNALYWLGATYFMRSDYNRAAVTFLRGYREFPDGSKAPDNLLKLGVSLGKLEKKAEACATFAELANKFPGASATIQKKAKGEADALGCG
ncbi:MAG: tol-pal system protein YbgF [Alphaproteobacteria bacterium]|nr:tol-pal system protein YbgF [Alphaproteobacteria bacterium]